MTKTDKAIYNRADEIWAERVYEQPNYSYLKALAQSWREYYLRSKRGPQRYRFF